MKAKITYEEFVDKFKPKKTTDDCYTPPLIYETVKEWVCREYGIKEGDIVRPFWPGGDYEHFDYPEGCTVLDNPPFSILSRICSFYLERGIRFFLFAPSLTIFSPQNFDQMNHIVCNCHIVYENGAKIHTSFMTNLGGGDIVAQTSPELSELVNDAVKKTCRKEKRNFPKYEYPPNVCTSAMLENLSRYGISFKIRRGECTKIKTLDGQRSAGKTIYGGGLLISDKLAAEKEAAEKEAAEKKERVIWELSERERGLIRSLG